MLARRPPPRRTMLSLQVRREVGWYWWNLT
jgi:hypothetical protein